MSSTTTTNTNNNNNSSTTGLPSPTSETTSNNKRKLEEVENSSSPKEKTTNSNIPPPMVALPPPLMQYPNGQLISVVHHPHQQPYYQMYHPQQQPFYYPVSPQQHPFMTTQPENNNNTTTPTTTRNITPRILPKNNLDSPSSSPAGALYPQPPPSPFYHPYAIQMSPTLIPNYDTSRHNSISSSPGLGPTTNSTTADQREKARKVSHSAIERRRRERINDKILQLKQLIPSCAEQDNLHKMSILQSAIDYISYLKDIVKSLDEHGTETTTEQLLKGDHLKIKMVKSMLPKEIEPFTTQFSINKEQQRGLKPMDVIKSGTPLTPPQDIVVNNRSPELPTTPLLKPDEQKHMSLQNILC